MNIGTKCLKTNYIEKMFIGIEFSYNNLTNLL